MDKKVDDLIVEFVAAGGDPVDWEPNWNVRPTDPIPVIIESPNKESPSKESTAEQPEPLRRVALARWSLTPGWSKTLKMKVPTFNARSEGITEKASFKGAVKSKRALIPASGYYEWQTDPVTKKKTPFYLRGSDDETLAFAGLYSWWRDHSKADDDPERWVLTATILTADAVHTLDHIHDRNPVPLPPEWWADWLDPRIEGDQAFVDAAVAAAVGVAETLDVVEVVAVTDDAPVAVTEA